MSNRKSLNRMLRFEVFKRDGFTCVYCGRCPPDVVLHCDHVVPVCDGGPDDEDNLVTSCKDCNLGKAARELTVAPLTVDRKAELMREREEQLAAYNAMVFAKLERLEQEAWQVANVFIEAWRDDGITHARFATIERFLRALPFADVYEAAQIGIGRFRYSKDRGFRYFCGVCWRRIRPPSAEDEG